MNQDETDQLVIENLKKLVIESRDDKKEILDELDAWCDVNIDLLMNRIERTRFFSRRREKLKSELTVFEKVKAKIMMMRALLQK